MSRKPRGTVPSRTTGPSRPTNRFREIKLHSGTPSSLMNNMLQQPLPRMASVTAALLAAATSLTAQVSPVGSWDFVMRGDQKGVAQITFSNNFTLGGTEVVTIKPAAKADTNPRGGFSSGDRGDGESSTGSTNVFFYGTTDITGVWGFDVDGRVIGVLIEGEGELVNGVSFRGKITGSKFNLVGKHERRTIHYRGIRQTPLPDIQGRFYSTGQRDGKQYVSIFDLRPDPDMTPNKYVVIPFLPPFDQTNGTVLLSGQNHLAMATLEPVGTNVVLSATSGDFKINKVRGTLTGIDEIHMRVTSKVFKMADFDDE